VKKREAGGKKGKKTKREAGDLQARAKKPELETSELKK
jgi:hypothetical protein